MPDTPQTILAGQTAIYGGTASFLNGYASSITLSCTSGLTAPPSTCTPTPPVVSTGANTFTVAASDVVGDYYFNVQGVGSDPSHITHQTAVVLHISSAAADFLLSEPTTFPAVNAGSINTSGPIGIAAINGFAGIVALSCSVNSGTGSCSASPASVSAFPATTNVTVNAANLIAGSYQLSVKGASGSLAHTLPVPFNVGDYQLSGTQTLTIAQGAQGTANLTITPSRFYSGNINASCDVTALPGATCALSPANPIIVGNKTPVPLTVTVGILSNAAPGNYNVNISTQDTSGFPSHSFALTVTVTVAQDFSINSATPSQTINSGQTTGAYQLTVAPNPTGSSFPNPVTLSCSAGLPTGAQCNFTPNPVTPGNTSAAVAMTIATSSSTNAGSYTVTVTGTSGSLSHSLTEALTVTPTANDFTLTLPAPVTADAGAPATALVTVTSTVARSIQVNVSCDDSALPGAQSCSPLNPPSPIAVNAGASVRLTATINVPYNAAPGTYTVGISARDTTGSLGGTFPLTIIQDFSVNSATPSQTVSAGQTTGAYQLTVAPNPTSSTFPGAVTLSCPNGLPSGAQCLFSPSTPVTPGNGAVNLVMTISTAAPSGSFHMPGNGRPYFYAVGLMLPGIVIACGGAARKQRYARSLVCIAILFLLAICLTSCGGGSNVSGGGGGGGGKQATKYTVAITATSGSLSHSINVDLVVQ